MKVTFDAHVLSLPDELSPNKKSFSQIDESVFDLEAKRKIRDLLIRSEFEELERVLLDSSLKVIK